MNAPTANSAVKRAGPRLPAWLWPGVVLVVLAAVALDTKVVRIGSSLDTQAATFSPEAYGKKAFPPIRDEIEKHAVDAAELAAAIAEDKAAAGEKYGKPGSVGPIFPVKFAGVVGEGNAGIFNVAVSGLPSGLGIRVQTGPAINGTDVRDATGTVTFGQFTNQIEYQDAGSALNNEIKSQVLAKLDRDKLTGKKIEVVGVFQLINPANWLVTPVRLEVK